MVFTTNHMADTHIDIIHDYTEVIGWSAISTTDDQIIQLVVTDFDAATDLVIKNDAPLFRVTETDTARLTFFCRIIDRFDFWMIRIVARHLFVGFLLSTDFIQQLFRRIALVGFAFCQ
ncbi:Uncharacterised protein [Vibrio cholerae]|nr:Uncharacterised protein [Vibrio cholerae]